MGKQSSFLRFEGNVGGVTFYKNSDGYQIREKGGVNKNKIAHDPRYARTRENMSEFQRAATAGRVLREAFSDLVKLGKDRTALRRLTRLMKDALKADTTSIRGQRNITDGNAGLVQGFEFNANVRISQLLGNSLSAAIDRVAGTLTVNVDSFIPMSKLAAPEGATHFKLVSGGAAIDFATGDYVVDIKESAMIPLNMTATAALNLVNNVTANSTHALFLAVGIQFFQEMNGDMYPLLDTTSNALTIIKADSL